MTALASRDHDIAMMHVHFGHRAAEREHQLFEKQAAHFQAKEHLVVEMPHFARIGGGARMDRKLQIEDVLALSGNASKCYLPGLIPSLLAAAFNWAAEIGASSVFLGISENLGPPGPRTADVFPDYSRDYLQLARQSFEVAWPWRPISIEAPLLELNRAEIIKLGVRLKSPLELTWSCLSSGTTPCGGCLGCATRNRGFLDASVPDPLLISAAKSPAPRPTPVQVSA